MNQLRIATGVMALGAVVWIVGALAPWSSIGDRTYPGLSGSEAAWALAGLVALVVVASGLVGRAVASAARWLLLPVAALLVLLTVVIIIDVATSTSADVAQGIDGPPLTRENAWGVWISLVGAVVATIGGIGAALAPSPRGDAAPRPS
ncbi:hypothetical protein [Aeromicrobium sp. Leaf350]|uniref:hypothetical protein n=1 Tax=Aeromicrobium sp. Leaf350 TaxID=2876565 RepID=UPI001E5D1D02|nr:hypothetical protein [Aeromicrobium sp. Leaf350]